MSGISQRILVVGPSWVGDMIMAQRAYEINSKAIKTADEMLAIVNNISR